MLDVAFNPAVLQESNKDKTEVYMLTLSFAQQHHGMRLSQEYTVVSCSPKSNPEDLHRRLGFRQWPYTSSKTDTGRAERFIPNKPPQALYGGSIFLCRCRCIIFHLLPKFLIIYRVLFTASQTPADLLQQITALRSEKQHQGSGAQIDFRPAEQINMDLIQVISTTFVQPQKPEYQLEVKTDKEGVARSMEITLDLPKVCSMSECQLRISKVTSYTLL